MSKIHRKELKQLQRQCTLSERAEQRALAAADKALARAFRDKMRAETRAGRAYRKALAADTRLRRKITRVHAPVRQRLLDRINALQQRLGL